MAKGAGGTNGTGANGKSRNVNRLNSLYPGEFNPKTVFGRELTSADKVGVARFRASLTESKDIWDINVTKLNAVLKDNSKAAVVEVKDIYPMQNYLNKNRVAEYMSSPSKNLSDRKLNITGYRLPNGKVILDDGHHRVAASIVNGDKSVTMQVIDVSPYLASKYFKNLSKKK